MKLHASPNLPTSFHGGCIRFDTPNRPRLHENGTHVAVGLDYDVSPDGITITAEGELRIELEKGVGGRERNIVSMGAHFDESMSELTARGWAIGCSSGVGHMLVRFLYTGRDSNGTLLSPVVKKASHPTLYGTNWNIWFWAVTVEPLELVPGDYVV